jgi:hypothetical protein
LSNWDLITENYSSVHLLDPLLMSQRRDSRSTDCLLRLLSLGFDAELRVTCWRTFGVELRGPGLDPVGHGLVVDGVRAGRDGRPLAADTGTWSCQAPGRRRHPGSIPLNRPQFAFRTLAEDVSGADEHQHDDRPSGRALTRLAVSATLHCLTGCAIGEILGLVLATWWGWSNGPSIALAIVLAFMFGYSLTIVPVLRSGLALKAAVGIALAADTVSILTMEIIDKPSYWSSPAR